MLLILIFNRKRVGEMEKLFIEDYKKKHNIQKDSETYRSLKPSEQIFSQRYVRVEIRGKLGRAVSLMISQQEVAAIDLILKYRTEANVHHKNQYVFGRGVDKYFEGARCLRDAANNCGADRPELLRGTKLRKHIATISQALNLTENDLAILADYMGHNIDIHRQFYRLPNEAIHLAKISQLLFALDNNKIDKFKGKNLNDIDIGNMDIENETDNEEYITNVNQTEISNDDNRFRACQTAAVVDIIQNRMQNVDSDDDSNCNNDDRLTVSPIAGIQEEMNETMKHGVVQNLELEENLQNKEKNYDEETDWTPDRKRKKVRRLNRDKRPWQTPEKFAIRSFFKKHLEDNTLPSSSECVKAIEKHSALKNRTKIQIKLWVSNELRRCKRNSCTKKLFP